MVGAIFEVIGGILRGPSAIGRNHDLLVGLVLDPKPLAFATLNYSQSFEYTVTMRRLSIPKVPVTGLLTRVFILTRISAKKFPI